MRVLILASWNDIGKCACFIVQHNMPAQDMADYIVRTSKEQGWESWYPDHITISRNGRGCPVFMGCYFLGKDYHPA